MNDKQQQKHEQKVRQARVKAQINCNKARRKLLRQRKKLAQRRTRNWKQSEARRGASNSDGETAGNPSKHSTLPPQKSNAENAARNSHSTIPKSPKYSDMPTRERLYGLRLHRRTAGESLETHGSSDESSTKDEANDE